MDSNDNSEASVSPRSSRKLDLIALSALGAGLLVFLLPMLAGWQGVLLDDGAQQAFPRLMAVARHLQQGELPLWDPNTFCGARPFYAMVEGPIYNVLLYPFMLLADLTDPAKAYPVLYLAPLAMFVLLGAAGMYAFGRRVVRVGPAAAALMGAMYATSPEFGVSLVSLHGTCVLALLPWLLLAVGRYLTCRSVAWWCAGVLLAAQLTTASEMNMAFRAFVLTGGIALLWCALGWRCEGWRALLPLGGVVAMLLLSVGLGGVMWAGILEGISWIAETHPVTFDSITCDKNSMDVGNLITLFIPDYNGLISSRHAWGSALNHYHSFILSGGMFGALLVLSSLVSWAWPSARQDTGSQQRRWAIVGAVVQVFTVLVLLGRHTPFLKGLTTILPWFFLVPFPCYFRFAQCWSFALLVGLGLTAWGSASPLGGRLRHLLVGGYVLAVAAAATLLLLQPLDPSTGGKWGGKPACSSLIELGEARWFLTRPALYFGVAALALAAGVRLLRRRQFVLLLAAGALVEAAGVGYLSYYVNEIISRAQEESSIVRYGYARARSPADHPFYALACADSPLAEAQNGGARFTGSSTELDNLAWVVNGHSAMGYDAKPMIVRFEWLITRFTQGYPYQMSAACYPAGFLANMNVGLLVAYEGTVNAGGPRFTRLDGMPAVCLQDSRLSGWPGWSEDALTSPALNVYALPQPLPYVYFQDRVVVAGDGEQASRLLFGDLREAVFVDRAVAQALGTDRTAAPVSGGFSALQQANTIRRIDRRMANSLRIDVEVMRPAMLVRAEVYHEGWRAFVDGKQAPLWQVNFLQQGVWLPAGPHQVELRFMPPNLVRGALVSMASLAVLLAVAAVGCLNRRAQGRGALPMRRRGSGGDVAIIDMDMASRQ